MKFSSEDIAHQRFESRFRGYDTDQVREFLVVVARELEDLVQLCRQHERELTTARTELADYRRREKSLQETLEMARTTAIETKERAEREAEVLVAEAELEAQRIRAEAQADADRIREVAQAEAERASAAAQVEVTEAREEVRELRERRVRAVSELRATLEMHLHLIDSQKTPEWVESREIERELQSS